MASKAIGVGIVGLGRAGWGMHTKELNARTKKFKVVAACDPIKERRQMMEDAYGCATYKTIEELLQNEEVELVDIATLTPDHTPHALMALKAGKKVFLEKPIAISYQEAKKLERATRKKPGSLFIRHNRRFEPGFQHVKEIIDSGILGNVYEIKLRRQSFHRRGDWQTIIECGGGQLLNWGPHLVDHALQFLDGQVDSIWSDLRKIAAVGNAEDHVHIILKGGKNRVVDLEISGGVSKSEPLYTVFGTKGALTSCDGKMALRYLDPKKKLARSRATKKTPPIGGGFAGKEELKWIEKEIPFKPKSRCNCSDIWDHLYASIRQNKPFPVKLGEALQVMEVITKARKGTAFEL